MTAASKRSERGRVLITGIAGGLAALVAERMAARGYEVIGVDYRPLRKPLKCLLAFHQANYNKTRIEDLFRAHRPTHVLHLGRVGNLKEEAGKRFDLNVVGSRKVLDLTLKYQTRRLVVLSTFHIYGAHPHNHIPIAEEEPLRAGSELPQIADAIQLDHQAVIWAYRHPEVGTVVLRPVNVIGPHIRNEMSRVLRSPAIPVIFGFSPMMQFIYEEDLAALIVVAVEGGARSGAEREPCGVFNVAGCGSLPWRQAVRVAGARAIPVPGTLALAYLGLAGLFYRELPPYMVNYFKYPCVISDQALRGSFDWEPRVRQEEAIRRTVARVE
jgi:UDP-glucose 4-epimerase